MLHTNRDNADAMDRDHRADPYDLLLRAGICRKCGQPCAWPPETPAAIVSPFVRRALAGELPAKVVQ
jgi:hypothetical protein